MQHLKLFNESDSWAGSLYAYNTRMVPVESQVLIPEKTFSYKCNDCDTEFYAFKTDIIKCKRCQSENVKSSSYNEASKSLTHKREVLSDIKDILLEASDLKPGRISTNVEDFGFGGRSKQIITIKVSDVLTMKLEDFEDVIYRLREYFSIHNITVSLFFINDDPFSFNDFSSVDFQFPIKKIEIYINLSNL